MIRVAVFDTNVLVSGLWQPHGPSGLLLDALGEDRIAVAYTGATMAEYTEVLFRPALGFAPQNIARLIAIVNKSGVLVHPRPIAAVYFPDPDDAIFIAAALALAAPALVTGNVRHYPPRCRRGVTVLTPREAIEQLQAD